MKSSNLVVVLTSFAWALSFNSTAVPDETYDIVLDGLDNPFGLAVHPDTGNVYVSESSAGRVVRVIDGKVEEVITGFPRDSYSLGSTFDVGPLGLAFFDKQTLLVGGGGLPVGKDLIQLYYQWSPYAVKKMEANKDFMETVKGLMDGVLLLIEEE